MPEINLHVDGPHSPERTKEIADLLAECVRFLNYASMSGNGLTDPADVYHVLGALYTGTQRFPQLSRQLTALLAVQKDSGSLADNEGRDVGSQVAMAGYHLGEAHAHAGDLTTALQNAQQAISGLYAKDHDV
jgi:hypothetical protein